MTRSALFPKPVFDEALVLEAFEAAQIKPIHAKTLWRHLVRFPERYPSLQALSTAPIPDFPKRAVELLQRDFVLTTMHVVSRTEASDGSTTKLLLQLQDGRKIEAVIMRYGYTELRSYPQEEKIRKGWVDPVAVDGEAASEACEDTASISTNARKFASNFRATLCVSSQVGCSMGCTFCATGTMGLLANLCAGEILEQLYLASQVERIRNVVFMGMGEPLDNYQHVMAAIRGMVDIQRFSLSPGKITVSTVGVVPRLYQLLEDAPLVNLALSLHAPTQELRLKIVPTAKAWPVDRILEATEAFIQNQNDRLYSSLKRKPTLRNGNKENQLLENTQDVTDTNHLISEDTNRVQNRRCYCMLEYVLLGPDVNCSVEVAHQLGHLLSTPPERTRNFLLNVIPYNPTSAGEPHGYTPPPQSVINEFVRVVREYGVTVMVRQELGQDVNAACGQLVVDGLAKQQKKKARESASADMEDLGRSKGDKGTFVGSGTLRKRGMAKKQPQSTIPRRQGRSNVWTFAVEHRLLWLLAVFVMVLLLRVALKVRHWNVMDSRTHVPTGAQ